MPGWIPFRVGFALVLPIPGRVKELVKGESGGREFFGRHARPCLPVGLHVLYDVATGRVRPQCVILLDYVIASGTNTAPFVPFGSGTFGKFDSGC